MFAFYFPLTGHALIGPSLPELHILFINENALTIFPDLDLYQFFQGQHHLLHSTETTTYVLTH